MVHERFESILRISAVEDFTAELLRFAHSMDFSSISLTEVVDRNPSSSDFYSVTAIPEGMLECFYDAEMAKVDPVLQHCKRSALPVVWSRETYAAVGEQAQWDMMSAYGVKSGIAIALHCPGGKHCVVGIDSEKEEVRAADGLWRALADMQLFAVYAHEAAARLLVPQAPPPALAAPVPHLTPRELEILRWTTEGKTAWEVGNILGISERTAVQHTNNAMQKLDAVNKVQAAIKALRLGLIS